MEIANYIAAIDLGSSKIVGIIGARTNENILSVHAIEKEPSDSCIKRGCIQNVEETALKVKKIISKLENKIKRKIDKIYIGVGGQSIYSIDNKIIKQLTEETPITPQIIESLKEISMSNTYGNKEILDIIPSEYIIDGRKLTQPIGVYGSEIEVTHKIIIGRSSLKKNIMRMMEKLDVSLAGFVLSPLSSSSVLSEADKNLGVVLVDFGAGTTTLSIYKDGLLRYVSVIPIGGNTITKDISSLQILEEEAEKIKNLFGDASPEITESDTQTIQNKSNQGLDTTKIYTKTLHKIVLARTEEIAENINNQIRLSGIDKQQLAAGLIITGGASKLKNLPSLLKKKVELDVKFGTFQQTIQSQAYSEIGKDPYFSALLGILSKGQNICIKEIVKEPEPVVEIVPEPVAEQVTVEKEEVVVAEHETVNYGRDNEESGFRKIGRKIFDIFKETSNDEKLSD